MVCSIKKPTERRYVIRMWIMAAFCVLFSFVAALVFRLCHPHGVLSYLVAVFPRFPSSGRWSTPASSWPKKRTSSSAISSFSLCSEGLVGFWLVITVWAYMEDFAHAPHLDLVWVYPIFWLFVGISYCVVRARYR